MSKYILTEPWDKDEPGNSSTFDNIGDLLDYVEHLYYEQLDEEEPVDINYAFMDALDKTGDLSQPYQFQCNDKPLATPAFFDECTETEALEEYLDGLIDEVRGDEAHPLATAMQIIGDNLERQDEDNEPTASKESVKNVKDRIVVRYEVGARLFGGNREVLWHPSATEEDKTKAREAVEKVAKERESFKTYPPHNDKALVREVRNSLIRNYGEEWSTPEEDS